MRNYQNLLLEKRGEILLVMINRPEVRNALDWRTWEEIGLLTYDINNDQALRAVIITGAGDKAFASGADLRWLLEQPSVEALDPGAQGILTELENSIKPIIAAVNGYALGGGCELALACDIRIASVNAKFGFPEPSVGILPGAGGIQRLPRLVGKGKAKELIFTGEIIGAGEAARIGMVNKVVPHEDLLNAAFDMAGKIAAEPRLPSGWRKRSLTRECRPIFQPG